MTEINQSHLESFITFERERKDLSSHEGLYFILSVGRLSAGNAEKFYKFYSLG